MGLQIGAYQIRTGEAFAVPLLGWGAGGWGAGTWGTGGLLPSIRLWSRRTLGRPLFGFRGGDIFYWEAANGVGTRGVS